MCVLIAVNQLGFGAVIPVLPLYAKSFDVSQTAIGATVAVYGVARVFLGTAHRQGRGWFGAAYGAGDRCGGVTVLGNLWCAVAATYLETAHGAPGCRSGRRNRAHRRLDRARRHRLRRRPGGGTLAIYQGVFLFAVGIGPFPGGFLAERFGLEAPFLVYAVMGAAVTAVAWFGVAETRGVGGTPARP